VNVLEDFATVVGREDPVVAVGGRTKFDVGGAVDSAAREVRAPTGIVEYEPAEMTVRVRAGTTVEELDDALAATGQCVALPSSPKGTICSDVIVDPNTPDGVPATKFASFVKGRTLT
jgi:glycolate oxidase FAD binding subunit